MKKLREEMQQQLDLMVATGKLFRADVSGHALWSKYLASFEDDPKFRDPESTVHNCNHCNNFLKRYGNIVTIDANYKIVTLFDFVPTSTEFIPVVKALSKMIKKVAIRDVFFETFESLNSLPYEACKKTQPTYKLGVDSNVKRYTPEEALKFGVVEPDEIRTFEHMSLQLPTGYVKYRQGSIEQITAKYRDDNQVFIRAMQELNVDTLLLVKDLILQDSLLDGTPEVPKIDAIVPLMEVYNTIPEKDKLNWCWVNSYDFTLAKFKNSLVGVLCTELAEGMELNKACQNWNKRKDPVNYMKASAPITKKQIKEAKLFVEDNGYESSFARRAATIDDIKASEILHLNAGDGKVAKISVFDNVKSTSTRHKKSEFDGVEEVSIDKFMKDILPGCTGVEAMLKSEYENHMMTLTTTQTEESKPIFKWPNNYSWTFNGNLAGKSMIKEAVKSLGGKVDGAIRFSIMWSEEGSDDNSDLDAHCIETPGQHIYFSHRKSNITGGNLDVDITQPLSHRRSSGKDVVENITYPSIPTKDMKMEFNVHQFSGRNSKGFKAEIEFEGELYSYEYNTPVKGTITVAELTIKDGKLSIKHNLPANEGFGTKKEFYGLESNLFHKVNLICLSPNHWGDSEVGNKHYFFMLEGARSPVPVRGFHNENLITDLQAHRKVMEVLANTTLVEPNTKELSGLGFNSTVRDDIILRLKGTHKRVIRVKF